MRIGKHRRALSVLGVATGLAVAGLAAPAGAQPRGRYWGGYYYYGPSYYRPGYEYGPPVYNDPDGPPGPPPDDIPGMAQRPGLAPARPRAPVPVARIEAEVATAGLKLVAKPRHNGRIYLAIAEDRQGRRRRLVFDAYAGTLLQNTALPTPKPIAPRAAVPEAVKPPTEAVKPPTETKKPPAEAKAKPNDPLAIPKDSGPPPPAPPAPASPPAAPPPPAGAPK